MNLMATDPQKSEVSEDETALLFVYGTLLRGMENAAFLQSPEKVTYLGRGTILGKLYGLESFPAFVQSPQNESEIKGEIYKIDHPEVLFETLDLIEGYNHQHPQRSLFIRKKVTAKTDAGPKEVWVYVYNQPTDGGRLIASGDYRDYRLRNVCS